MIQIMFICHGNICRSPMAEFVLRDMLQKKNLTHKIEVCSSATSGEELGNPVHRGTRELLKHHGISTQGKFAQQFKREDYEKFDYLVAMDEQNIQNIKKIIGSDAQKKVYKLRDFTPCCGDIADPWYTSNFHLTYDQIYQGCLGLLQYVLKKQP